MRKGAIRVDGDDRCTFRTQIFVFHRGLRQQLALCGDFEEGLLSRTIAGRLGESDVVCIANALLSLSPSLFTIPWRLRLCHAQAIRKENGALFYPTLWLQVLVYGVEARSREVVILAKPPAALKAGTVSPSLSFL